MTKSQSWAIRRHQRHAAARSRTPLLFIEDVDVLSKPDVVRSIYDPTAGTGGMLSVADEHLRSMNPHASLVMLGQELNPESYAICKADMLIKGQPIDNIHFGNTLSADGLPGQKFDYMLSNPPFGVAHQVNDSAQRLLAVLRGLRRVGEDRGKLANAVNNVHAASPPYAIG